MTAQEDGPQPMDPSIGADVDDVHREVGLDDAPHGGVLDQARALFDAALSTFQASLALLRAEFALARSSAVSLIGLAAIALVLAIGTWLALLALIAAGVQQLVGNWFVGIGSVVLLNAAGIGWVVLAMRRRLRDMSMPRTRQMLSAIKPGHPASAPTASKDVASS